ncbi:helix-turn-helix domain-containing protein [Solicola gregarius]|uniref:Helix-turn-helix domain-containing protein n=1 Tax=Solicola gregarius TaxID=2908642 RepID=A0AA46TF99_9ACTN|nr:helix-turn-helix domain-containing protein [Solicola gregarius]UYM04282.1 helix-turn-helix domain-containing protein [Solicola gregarius]
MRDQPRGMPQAILRPKAAEATFEVERLHPRTSLAPFVDYLWLVWWHAPDPHEQQVVPQPRIHVAAEDGRLLVHGINRDPFARTLRGDGHVLGVAFQAGGFRPLLGSSVGALAGRVVPAGDLFGTDDRPVARAILETSDTQVMRAALEDYLEGRNARPDPAADEATALVAYAERTPSLTRADLLAAHAGMSLRTMQRLFTEYVGIGPKWVIQRFRLLDAAQAVHDGDDVDWAGLAAELGFSDQAHLTRVFTRVVGTPPATYASDPRTR